MGVFHLVLAFCLVTAVLAQKTITVSPIVQGNPTFTFSPSSLTVAVGEQVTFSFSPRGGNTVPHGFQFTSETCLGSDVSANCTACVGNLTCGPAPVCGDLTVSAAANFTQPLSAAAWDRLLTFDTIGTYYYYCPAHCSSGMFGTIQVVAATNPPTTQPPANTFCVQQTLNCKKTTQSCTRNPPTNVTVNWDRCKDINAVCYSSAGTNDGICTARARDQQACSQDVGCYDGTYSITCLSNNFCGRDKVFAPGEQCVVDAAQIAFYGANGGCAFGQCQADSLNVYRCFPSLKANDSCANGQDNLCNATTYCDTTGQNDICALRKTAGAACDGDEECQQDLLCLNDVCALPMSVPAGGSCDSTTDCVPGLICARTGGGNRVCQGIVAGQERACNTTNTCPTGYDCVCDSTTNDPFAPSPQAHCVAQCTFTNANRDSVRNYGSCLKRNNCYGSMGDELRLYRGGCVAAHCLAEFQAAENALNSCFRPNPLRCSTGSDATTILVSIAVMIVAALALFF